tara:strand:- start:527 stop:1123 length:597 start_codon:yes stop_codon:yes gene_type:complete
MVTPWINDGYDAWIVDIEHKPGIERISIGDRTLCRVGADLKGGWDIPDEIAGNIAFTSAFPPCTHLAVSGRAWFRGKGLRALESSIALFATASEVCEASGSPYLIENPVSTISTYWRQPDWSFAPWHYTGYEPDDNYKKRTCLWTGGGFKMPNKLVDPTLPEPDNRIHNMSNTVNRARLKSRTPMGFARAVHAINRTS